MYAETTSGLNAKQVFITPISLGGVAAGYTNEADIKAFVDSSNNGELGFFNAVTDTLISSALVEGQEYYIAQKRIVESKATIARSAIIKHKRNAGGSVVNAYGRVCPLVAGVNQTTTFVVPSAATLRGQTFSISIFNRGWGAEKYPQELYEFISVTGAESASDIATAIVANYTAQQTQYTNTNRGLATDYTITNGGTDTITIVAKDNRAHFTVSYSKDMALSATPTITNTVAWVAADGTAQEMLQLEWEGKYRDGFARPLDKHVRDFYGYDWSMVVSGCTYDVIYLKTIQDREVLDSMDAKLEYDVVLAFQSTTANTTGSPALTTVKTILEF